MKLLLDTCTFLWIAWDRPELSGRARALFADPANQVFLSAVSCWEMALKHGLGKLPLPDQPERLVPRLRDLHGIEPLALDEEAALMLHRLPALHRDPFDRMLVCQAIAAGLSILSPDPQLSAYPVRTEW
ncbi:MAG: type II toxin-antitoxin system VapC family toxin [Deltaproteobacteria bacterium]|nr:type II toxin-antitoxin system VapC family toxin [Deltaproteobacteria bacterium]